MTVVLRSFVRRVRGPGALLGWALLACAPEAGPGVRDDAPPAFLPEAFTPAEGATGVDPRATIVLGFVRSTCPGCPPCDIDPASIDGKLTVTPLPLLPPFVALDPEGCALRVQVPGGLRPSAAQRVRVAPGLRNLSGNVAPAETVLAFHTGEPSDPDRMAPRFVGSWPASGDDRVTPRRPVTVYFDEEVVAPAIATGAPGLLQRTIPSSWGLELVPADGWPPGEQVLSVSRVSDPAGNATELPATVRFTVTASDDTLPPAFAGLESAEATAEGLVLRWTAATDDRSPAAEIRYLVFLGPAATGPGPLPWLVTAPGRTELVLTPPPEPVTIRVLAQDAAGNVDANVALGNVP